MRKGHHVHKGLLFVFLCLLSPSLLAKDLGAIGAVFPITEPDLLKVLQMRAAALQQSGKLAQLEADLHQTLRQKMERPTPIVGLSRTTHPRTWLFDPSIQVPYDLKNDAGQVVVPAGARINPLDTVSLNETLLFYNADDPDQVRWAMREDKALAGHDKLILVGGSVASQMQVFKKPVYFDQGGRLTQRFQFRQVPVLISQQGNRLKIAEVMP